jgi:cyclic pyranopterin phosphate synthase
VRKNILGFIDDLAKIPGPLDLRLTTNGILLGEMTEPLLNAGIRKVNISLDTLNPTTFQDLSGHDEFSRVWNSLNKALSSGFDRVKINNVVIRNINDHELLDFARLSIDRPMEVRFIEYMPLGTVGFWSKERFVSTLEIMERLAPLGPLEPVDGDEDDGPAQKFRLPGAKGTIGFISPITQHFCSACNRIRITADGKLRLCLLANDEHDLKGPLRSGSNQDDLARILREAVKSKPSRHHLEEIRPNSNRPMNLIGG